MRHFIGNPVFHVPTVEVMARLSHIVLIIAMNALMCVLAEELYPDQYDNLDVKSILKNKELRDQYYNCLMEIELCKTPEQKAITAVFSEAYQTKCRRCTPKLIENLNLVVDWYVKNDPEKWQRMIKKVIDDLKKKNAAQQPPTTAGNTNG